MRSSLAHAASRPHPNTVRTSLDAVKPQAARVRLSSESARTEPNTPDSKAECLAAIESARIAAQRSHKEMQHDAGVSKSTYSEAANGVGNYAAHWLWNQPAEFWLKFWPLVCQAKGITTDTEESIRQREIADTADALWDRMVACFRKGLGE